MTRPDVIVIGSGPCGAAATVELLRSGLNVTMLDAGQRPVRGLIVRAGGDTIVRWTEPRQMRWDRHVPTGDPNTDWGSSLTLGGLSNYWTSAVPRMHPDDFSDGAALGEEFRWPISYEDLVPFYELVEGAMRITAGPPIAGVPAGERTYGCLPPAAWTPFVERASAAGHGIGMLPMAKGRPWMAALRPTAFTSYHCLIKPVQGNPRFRLVRGATAVRLDARPGQAGVEFVTARDHEPHRIEARAVVVAAGTLDTTRLLLQSRSPRFPDGLGNSSGLVGRYLHDHPRQWWPARLDRPMPVLSHPMYISRKPVGSDPPLMASSLTLGMVGTATRIKGWYGGRSDLIGVQVFGTMIPSPDSFVRLADRNGSMDPLTGRLQVHIQYDPAVLANVDGARDRLVEVLADAGLKVRPLGPFHTIRPGSSFHYAGTARMHADPALGVVDGWNRLHEAPNVIVCDASCFTTGPEKNPTLTAMAIAARAARHLGGDLTGRGTG
jgi:choline dehydrogenase-like flavoprotein